MTHFSVEQVAFSTLESTYQHSPTNLAASVADYFEDKLANGLEFISMSDNVNGPFWFFKVVATP